jgi:hypothetical protein
MTEPTLIADHQLEESVKLNPRELEESLTPSLPDVVFSDL